MMKGTLQLTRILLVISSLICSLPAVAKVSWKKVSPGLYYTTLTPNLLQPSSQVIAFKVDPKKYTFNTVLASATTNSPTAYVTELAKKSHGILAINGGYFSREQTPLGLRISNHKTLSKRKQISWWGIFYIKNKQPHLTSSNNFNKNKNISFAIQAGPRLVVNGKVLKLKPGIADRSALGITRNKKVVIAITKNLGLSLSQWATLLKQLGSYSALNLDGGSSSQLYVKTKSMQLAVPNLKPVTDAVVVKR